MLQRAKRSKEQGEIFGIAGKTLGICREGAALESRD
jgi:hypothetical protein